MASVAERLAWQEEWRRRVRAVHRLWLDAKGWDDGCLRLQQIKDVMNEQPPNREETK